MFPSTLVFSARMASLPPMPRPTKRLRSKTRPQGGTSAGLAPSAPPTNILVTKRLRSKTRPQGGTSAGLAPSAPLARANSGTPDADEGKKGNRWWDDTRWPWFALHTEDDAFKFRVSVALEAKRQSAGKVAVVWDSLTETQDGFALQWKEPALIRGGHMWWHRLLEKVSGSLASLLALIKDYQIMDCMAFWGQMSGWSALCQTVEAPLLEFRFFKNPSNRQFHGKLCP